MSKETPYLAVDFDVLEKVGPAGAACGLSAEQVYMALGKLWLYCWREKTEHVTTTHILGFFYGVNACEALLTFGFIAATTDGWRVKGADRWLFVQRKRSENGKANVGNLKRGTQPGPGKPPAPPLSSPAGPRDPPGTPSGSAPALTASSVQRPASNDVETKVGLFAQEVFDHWVTTGKRNANTTFTSARRTKVEARLREGYGPAQLKQAIDGCAVTPHNQGETDGQIHDDLELICRSAGQVDRFIRNAKSPPKRKGLMGPIDAATQSHTQTGWVNDF